MSARHAGRWTKAVMLLDAEAPRGPLRQRRETLIRSLAGKGRHRAEVPADVHWYGGGAA